MFREEDVGGSSSSLQLGGKLTRLGGGAMSPPSAWHLGHTYPISQGISGLSIRDSGT